jgi:hypothetical protein
VQPPSSTRATIPHFAAADTVFIPQSVARSEGNASFTLDASEDAGGMREKNGSGHTESTGIASLNGNNWRAADDALPLCKPKPVDFSDCADWKEASASSRPGFKRSAPS